MAKITWDKKIFSALLRRADDMQTVDINTNEPDKSFPTSVETFHSVIVLVLGPSA